MAQASAAHSDLGPRAHGRNVRLIARLDIKGPKLIKGVNLEGLRVIGDPRHHAQDYYEQGIDELLYMDVVASLYGRNSLTDVIRYTAEHIFVPLTVGGGIRSVQDVQDILRAGADKVAINTAAVQHPELISQVAERFGSQCMVLSIEAKRQAEGWEAYTDNGRERTGLDAVAWAVRGAELGAGEIVLTSVDQEGTRQGFDAELVCAVSRQLQIPVIASGGFGAPPDLVDLVQAGGADAVAIADAFHYRRYSVDQVRRHARAAGIPMREPWRCE